MTRNSSLESNGDGEGRGFERRRGIKIAWEKCLD